ncbi:group II intron maturase-specific domain-containing protein [Nostoc sp. TCL26-01]|uniref:group II intron maturase-specific domain-containing protein n=1 Tax=Nostoc sp. TCL26-01 TaxID=2576904 RepID=UPI0021189676|nr:group II intron maturase-specific domain-containing protein [Nostoc sp. TCL26-01]
MPTEYSTRPLGEEGLANYVQRLRGHLSLTQKELRVIKKLNPIIRGQANYFRVGVASKIFNSLDHWLYEKQKKYAKRTHRNKSDSWRKAKYWGNLNLDRPFDRWVFGNKQTGA